MSAIFYVLRIGCQWKALPRSLGASKYRYMTDFRSGERLVYSNVCGLMVYSVYDKKTGIDWKWQSMDGVITKAPLGGKKVQAQILQDQFKSGTKRSILVDGNGIPLRVSVDGANRHDMKMTKPTLQNVVINKPKPTIKSKQHICMDKGYDYPEVYELLEDYGYTIHIRLRGEEEEEEIARRYQNIEPDAGLLKEHIHG